MLASTIQRGTLSIRMIQATYTSVIVLVSKFVDKRQSAFRVILNRGATLSLEGVNA